MPIMFKSAVREHGQLQPHIKAGMFHIRLPLVHWEIEVPEAIQGMIVFMTGASATVYLEQQFGLDFKTAISIIIVHEFLYLWQNMMGDALIGGWITPAVPLIITYLGQYDYNPAAGVYDRIHALLALEILLGVLYVGLGVTKLAGKLVGWCPSSLKGGILMGAGMSACIGTYGFKTVENGGKGFWAMPITFTIGVLLALFLLFSYGFGKVKRGHNPFIKLISKLGFVPALLVAYVVGMAIKEIGTPVFTEPGIVLNPFPGLAWAFHNFTLFGVGLPPAHIFLTALPMAVMTYIIAFGDVVAGTAFYSETKRFREDEDMDISADRTNLCCGIRNIFEACFAPTCTMSGPLWTAMTVTVAERYKSGKDNMYSIFGGACTFNLFKVLSCACIPLMALVRPVLPLAMSLTLMIQAFGSFYVGMTFCRTNIERGVAGITACVIATSATPSLGLFVGIVLSIVCEFINTNRKERARLVADGMAQVTPEIEEAERAALKFEGKLTVHN
ncbi:MAG: hypothetical protein H6Q61_243 [Firmicutes bacterium]|nr:hypothetical protein [Bacillota bacterium]